MSQEELSKKIECLERRYDAQFRVIFNSIRELINAKPKDLIQVPPKRRRIGFGDYTLLLRVPKGIGIGPPLTGRLLPHHRTYGSRITAVRRELST